MAITILAPAPAVPYQIANNVDDDDDDDDDENGGVDLEGEGDSDMRPSKRARRGKDIVTPGETVTDDPQWMRYTSQCLRIQLFY
jgi:exosome complex component RRP4